MPNASVTKEVFDRTIESHPFSKSPLEIQCKDHGPNLENIPSIIG